MKALKGKVAVITGGASGIGRAMAERFAEEGMRIVLADVEQQALNRAEQEMKQEGADVFAVRVDVSKEAEVAALAERSLEKFGAVHLLCNNAGVGITGRTWEISEADWQWVLGVNLWGVIYGIRHFVPHMLERGGDGHIVNVASMAGLGAGGGMTPYYVSKHGGVSLSECLHQEFMQLGATIGVSVLCPGWVNTNISESDRNRPSGRVDEESIDASAKMFRDILRGTLKKTGLAPKAVAELVLQAVLEKKFYILPHQTWKPYIRTRMENILEERTPELAIPPEIDLSAVS